jgi:hypothetical protein
VSEVQLSHDQELLRDIGGFFDDPLGYVMYAYPWSKKPAFRVVELPEPWRSKYDSEHGPDGWACEYFEALAESIKERGFDPETPKTVLPVQMAVRSGHGIGKSALVGMLASFILDTRPGARGMVTANTGPQLHTKTWPQIKKWKSAACTSHMWRILENRIEHVLGEALGRLDAVTWKKEHSEAFAGQHAVDSSSFYINDEASAIHDEIWRVEKGGLTDGEPFFFAFGNPTRNIGQFHACFGRERARWWTKEVDSRSVQITNKELLNQWIEDYGIHSDFVRVRVLGKEPKAGEQQLIPTHLVYTARLAPIPDIANDEPIVMGIDIGRSPIGDESVIFVRRGRDARELPSPWGTCAMHAFRGRDTQQIGSAAAEWFDHLKTIGHPPSAIFVDGGGLGAGTYDRLNRLGYPAHEVLFGGNADNPVRFKDKAAEMWARAKAWLQSGGALIDDAQLEEQLTSRPHDHTDDNRMYLWPKKECKEVLGIESPDRADAFALTFAMQVAPRRSSDNEGEVGKCITEFDEFAED